MTSDRTRVLHFSNQEVRGGAEEHILSLLQRLDRNRFELHLAAPPKLCDKLAPDLPADVSVFRICLQKATQWSAAFELAKVLRTHRIQILHSHMFGASMLSSPVGWLCRVPVIIETPHVREHWRRGWIKGRYFVDRAIARLVDHYVAVSAANADYLAETKGIPRAKTTIVRSASDVSRFDPDRGVPAGVRESLGFAPDDPVLVMVGRLEPQKGHRVLLDAMPTVLKRFPRVRLVCLSDGQLRGALEYRTKELGLTDAVRFVGYQPDVADWLALADIHILPSFFEGLPLTVIEAMAAGRPVIASAVDGVPEVLTDGEGGLLVPPGDCEALASAICRLVGDPELRRGMARAGRQRVVREFSIERLVRETEDLYLKTSYDRDNPADSIGAEGIKCAH